MISKKYWESSKRTTQIYQELEFLKGKQNLNDTDKLKLRGLQRSYDDLKIETTEKEQKY
jgi:hypothetical protein